MLEYTWVNALERDATSLQEQAIERYWQNIYWPEKCPPECARLVFQRTDYISLKEIFGHAQFNSYKKLVYNYRNRIQIESKLYVAK